MASIEVVDQTTILYRKQEADMKATFIESGERINPLEPVNFPSFLVISPNREIIASGVGVEVGQGTWNAHWSVPADAQPGSWLIKWNMVSDRERQYEFDQTFTVREVNDDITLRDDPSVFIFFPQVADRVTLLLDRDVKDLDLSIRNFTNDNTEVLHIYKDQLQHEKIGTRTMWYCFPGDTLVLTESGWKEIRDVDSRERVLSGNGQNISSHVGIGGVLRRQYKGRVYKIKSMGLLPITATGNHEIPIREHIGGRTNQWHVNEQGNWTNYQRIDLGRHEMVSAENLHEKLKKDSQLPGAKCRFSIGMPIDRTVVDEEHLTKNMLRLLGAYVAEGSIDGERRVTWCLGSHERKWARRIKKLVKIVFGARATIKSYQKSTLWVRCSSIELVRFIRKYIRGSVAKEKELTTELMRLPIQKQRTLLAWMRKGDRCVLSGNSETKIYTTASKKLALQVQQLYLRRNKFARIAHRVRSKDTIWPSGRVTKKGGHIYNIWLKGDGRFAQTRFDGDIVWLPIRKIEEQRYDGYVYTLANAGRWHKYTTQGGLVGNCDLPPFGIGSFMLLWSYYTTSYGPRDKVIKRLEIPPMLFWDQYPKLADYVDRIQKDSKNPFGYFEEDLLQYMHQGLGMFNRYHPATSFTLQNFPRGLGFETFLMEASAYWAFRARQLGAGELVFNYSGQEATLEADRQQAYGDQIAAILDNLNTHLTKAKLNFTRHTYSPARLGMRLGMGASATLGGGDMLGGITSPYLRGFSRARRRGSW